MSYVMTPGYSGAKVTIVTVTDIAPMPGAKNISYIHKTGETFRTKEVQQGDGVVITSSGQGNDGTYLVLEVVDEEVVIVRGNLALETGIAQFKIDRANHLLTITDETTTDWETIRTTLAEEGYVRKMYARGGNGELYLYLHSFSGIDVTQTSAIDTLFTSKEEIVVGTSTVAGSMEIDNTGSQGQLTVQLGELHNSSDRRSYKNGSVWIGIKNNTATKLKITYKFYGSCIMMGGTETFLFGEDDEWFGVLARANLSAAAGSQTVGVELQDILNYAIATPVMADDIAFADNVIVSFASTAGIFIGPGTAILENNGLSGEVVTPSFNSFNMTLVQMLNLLVDRELSDTLTMIFGSTLEKAYTFNPIFTDVEGNPLSGATVSLFEIDDAAPATENEISGSPFTTDVNGQIGSGAGTDLVTQDSVSAGVYKDYSFRVIVEAAGYIVHNHIIKPLTRDTGERVLTPYTVSGETIL